ncbi:MAG: bifunctional oligoribonuclease/PAP phosphatase NrnA [Leptospiraceae bacterium]|nr:bifunctional oligoribonuclease/PAP phosphatase NrnA [Leptospiraceae bacterium]MCB1303439.1 bifunctional oligoribonuclease/PAP phosphatase NrnA [Leptospiraceae bacterium]
MKSCLGIIITTHRGPDPDGLGAEIALNYLLLKLGFDSRIINHDEAPAKLAFLLEGHKIETFDQVDAREGRERLRGRTVISIDNSDPDRIGDVGLLLDKEQSNLIIVDHHDGARPDYERNFQDPGSASSCELVYRLYESAGQEIPPEVALPLYAGIVADTGHFRYGKTTPETHRVAARLLETGIKPEKVAEGLLNNQPLGRLEAKKKLYQSLRFSSGKSIAFFSIRRDDIEKLGLEFEHLDGLVNELLEPGSVKAAVLFTERERSRTRISVRSRSDVNVLGAVQKYGGGGHKNACGATVDSPLDSAIAEFIPVLQTQIGEPTQGSQAAFA